MNLSRVFWLAAAAYILVGVSGLLDASTQQSDASVCVIVMGFGFMVLAKAFEVTRHWEEDK